MKPEKNYIELFSNPATVPVGDIPVLSYLDFIDFTDLLMKEEGTHCLTYFVVPEENLFRFICCMAADENRAILVYSHLQPRLPLPELEAISSRHFQFHVFEREIHENIGITFLNHPWLKPVRYPFHRADRQQVMDNYPFYSITGEALHEVGVGPVHAGIIEPGHFRFICQGEQVHHLEIQLGYQHRGAEELMRLGRSILHQTLVAESIAGDTTVGHTLAFAGAMEALSGIHPDRSLQLQRSVALELERMAVHIGDTAALCNDVAYQFGQVVCEALRTVVINTTQLWCGNRFAKGLIRVGGTHYPLTEQLKKVILTNLQDIETRFNEVTARIFTLPSVLGRFEGVGIVTPMQASLAGVVGMAARSSGVYRDIRWSHPFGAYEQEAFMPEVLPGGDVHARAWLRKLEVAQSIAWIRKLLENPLDKALPTAYPPEKKISLRPSLLSISLTEGWRGEIVHAALTDEQGGLRCYKVKDPSFHNWMALALAVRNQEISDFPLCNKSYNLSYCGHDL
jgi:Ni,Fe-hydrogenase III large subunit